MEFLCFSDTHGSMPPDDMSSMPGKYVLHAGDVYDRLTKSMTMTPLLDLDAWGKAGKELLAVRGNHDVLDPCDAFKSSDATGRIIEISPALYVIGLGWHGDRFYELPDEGDLEPTCQSVMRQAAARIPSGAHTILLTHYPPFLPDVFKVVKDGKASKRAPAGWMFDCVRATIDAFRPLAVIGGHVHGMFGMTADYNGTLVAFPGPTGGVLEIDASIPTATFRSLP